MNNMNFNNRFLITFIFLFVVFAKILWGDSPYGAKQVGTAVGGIEIGAYKYDSAGNRQRNTAINNLQTIDYGLLGKPEKITNPDGGIVSFQYGVRSQKFLYKHLDKNKLKQKTFYVGDTEHRVTADGKIRYFVYIRNGNYAPIAQVEISNSASPIYRYNLLEQQGSLLCSVTDNGGVQGYQRYDPWGLTTGADGSFVEPNNDNKGYTGHETIASSGLIHMNGRIYEPDTAMFVSPDPYIQQPQSPPNLNPYCLIMNSPVNGIDPTGYAFELRVTEVVRKNTLEKHGIDLINYALTKINKMEPHAKQILNALINSDDDFLYYARYNVNTNRIITHGREKSINFSKLKKSSFTGFKKYIPPIVNHLNEPEPFFDAILITDFEHFARADDRNKTKFYRIISRSAPQNVPNIVDIRYAAKLHNPGVQADFIATKKPRLTRDSTHSEKRTKRPLPLSIAAPAGESLPSSSAHNNAHSMHSIADDLYSNSSTIHTINSDFFNFNDILDN